MLNRIYNSLPATLQNIVVSAKGWLINRRRYSANFKECHNRFLASDYTVINHRKISQFIIYASKLPFWKDRFEKYNINIHATDILNEIKKLPVLTKEEVKDNINRISNKPNNERTFSVATSGTTGSGLKFLQTITMENAQWAVWWRYRYRLGITFNTWMGWFGGKIIIDRHTKKPPYVRINIPAKQVMFSPIHLSIDTVEDYYNELIKRKLKWIHGYPSQIALLASLIKEKDLPFLKMDFITTGSENLYEHQKKIIKEVFGQFPMQHYGLAEGVANLSQLPTGKIVADQDFAFCEFIHHSGNQYKIIGTNYHNIAFPLIRYDTNDLVSLNEIYEITEIDGRSDDYIVLPSGVKLGRLGFIFKDATYVKEAQIYQKSQESVKLRVVKGKGYIDDIHEHEILKNCRERFGDEIKIDFEYYDALPKTKSGKLKYVISEVQQ